jgi:predicted dehydrogenase
VLCEKPLCWDVEEAAGHADRHAGAFLAQGLHLAVNTQWPHTLEAYRALHPGILDEPPHSFSMRLSPDGVGAGMIPEAVPHALSLLQAVLPDPEALVARPGARLLRPDASALELTFDYLAGGCEVACRVTLVRGRGQPREAAFAFDGHPARRRVEMGGYRLFLEDGRRSVPLPDPVPRRVGDFLGAVASGEPPRVDPAAVPGMRMLVDLHEAVLHEASCTGEGAT